MEIFAVFLPLIGAICAGFLVFSDTKDDAASARIDSAAQWITSGCMILAAVIAGLVFWDVAIGNNPHTVELFTWIDSGALEVSWAVKLDTLSTVMLFMVTVVSSVIHVYSIGYMHHDHSIPRFMCYLSLFTFFMLMLVSSDNLLQLFFGWEGVGLCSYLLIGFWYDRPAANAAAIKAFVVNRVGDFGFALGIFAVFVLFQTIDFDTIFAAVPGRATAVMTVFGFEFHAITVAAILLFIGAMGKSAQLGLHTWLPDAMEGPTPVSALIHAATMVVAGVYLVGRMFPLFVGSGAAIELVAYVGGFTALFAAIIGCFQDDIKRVLAFSTLSQLGYMMLALGVAGAA
ncbi:MAG: NADH-quinone oxidoreductase subunit L, partial [Rhodospirillaceae bacterium]|nr:NADH-quinone oxidoreductase subunit L [Rhodospirillaceae bacterium]